MQRSISALRPFAEEHPKACPELKAMLKEISKIVKGDPLAKIREPLDKHYGSHTFYRRNPTHCGLWIHNARLIFHKHAMAYIAVPGGVMCTTQLYHALRNEQLLDQEWTDLQTLWDMQGNLTYFVGDPPINKDGYLRNYCMSLGTSITNWAPNNRTKKINTSQAGVRQMMFMGTTSTRMALRSRTNGDERPITGEDIQGFIAEGEVHRTHHSSANGASQARLPLIH